MKVFMKAHMAVLIALMIGYVLAGNLITSAVTAPFVSRPAACYFLTALCKWSAAFPLLLMMRRWNPRAVEGVSAAANDAKEESARRGRQLLSGCLLGLPGILVIATNTLPFVLINPVLFRVRWLSVLAIALAGFGIAVLEETGCRGVFLPLLCEKWSGRKNASMKAALVSSFLFGGVHLLWLVNALVFRGSVSPAECFWRLYQVYFTFCGGMLWAGMTLYTKSIVPAVLCHALIDITAYLPQGILNRTTYEYYYVTHPISMETLLVKWGMVKSGGQGVWILMIGLDTVMLLAGILITKRLPR